MRTPPLPYFPRACFLRPRLRHVPALQPIGARHANEAAAGVFWEQESRARMEKRGDGCGGGQKGMIHDWKETHMKAACEPPPQRVSRS